MIGYLKLAGIVFILGLLVAGTFFARDLVANYSEAHSEAANAKVEAKNAVEENIRTQEFHDDSIKRMQRIDEANKQSERALDDMRWRIDNLDLIIDTLESTTDAAEPSDPEPVEPRVPGAVPVPTARPAKPVRPALVDDLNALSLDANRMLEQRSR